MNNTKHTNLETLSIWNAHHTELQAERSDASGKLSSASGATSKAQGLVDRIQAQLNFYEKPAGSTHYKTGGTQQEHDRLRNEISDARESLLTAKDTERAAIDSLEAAESELSSHALLRPIIEKTDVTETSKSVADLRDDIARVGQRLNALELQGDGGPTANATAAVESAKQRVEETAAGLELGEASAAEFKRSVAALTASEMTLEKAQKNSISHNAAIAGLSRRLKNTRDALTTAESAQQQAAIEFGAALHRQAVKKINDVLSSPTIVESLTTIAVADRLLKHARSDISLSGGYPALEIALERHTHISGFDNKCITADSGTDTKASALIEELGLTL